MEWEFLEKQPPLRRLLAIFAFLTSIWFAANATGTAQGQPAHHEHPEHEGMSMPMDAPMDAAAQAKLQSKILADKKESEFNHHLAGLLVAVAGVFILFQSNLVARWPAVNLVWPACFLLAGNIVLVCCDTVLWPFGHRQWLEALQNNREVLQHKTFAILLLLLGAVELQ